MPGHPSIPDPIIRWLRSEKQRRVNFELDEEAWNYLEAIAREEGVNVNEISRSILREALEARSAWEANLPQWELLSAREKQAAWLYSQGIEMEEIAKELGIAKETVKTHLYKAQKKLGLRKMDELRTMVKKS